jgi:hypothetical protein
MAAYLVSQHDGSFSTLSNANGAADAIQQAIWAIANNSLGPVGGGADIDPIVGNTLGGDTTNSYRVNQALQFYNDTNNSSSPAEVALLAQFTSQWAVISWGVNSTGTLLSYYLPLSSISSPGDENQTFLVQVDHPGETPFTYSRVFTPEPAFYGALAVGWQAFSSSLSECEFPEPRLEDNYVSELTSKHSSGFVICPSSTQRSAFLRYSHVGEV